MGAGVRGVYTNRSRAHRFRKPVWLIKVHAGTEELRHGPGKSIRASSATRQCARDRPDRSRTRHQAGAESRHLRAAIVGGRRSEVAGQPASRSPRRPYQMQRRPPEYSGEPPGHRSSLPDEHPDQSSQFRSHFCSATWRVKDSNLGRHQPTDLQFAIYDAATSGDRKTALPGAGIGRAVCIMRGRAPG